MAKGLLWMYLIFFFIAAYVTYKLNESIPYEQSAVAIAILIALAICESIEKVGKKK